MNFLANPLVWHIVIVVIAVKHREARLQLLLAYLFPASPSFKESPKAFPFKRKAGMWSLDVSVPNVVHNYTAKTQRLRMLSGLKLEA